MTPETGDAELLRRYVRKDDQDAFAELVRRHVGLVFGAALRVLGDRAGAEDVSQEVFLALARKAAWLCQSGSLAGWLHRAAVLEARQRLRGQLRRDQRERLAIDLATTMHPHSSAPNTASGDLDEALLELGDRDRTALTLRFFEQRGFREIGRILGISEDAAQKRVAKALQSLTRSLARRGVAVTSTAATARAMEAAVASAPDGLAAGISAAVASSTTGWVAWPAVGSLVSHLLTMTKIQTTAVCLVLAAVPFGHQWRAAASAAHEHDRLSARLAQHQGDLEIEAFRLAQIRRRAESLDRTLGIARGHLDRLDNALAHGSAEASAQPPMPRWDDNAEYATIPKWTLSNVVLSMGAASDPANHHPAYAVGPDGALSEAVRAALAISPAEQEAVRASVQQMKQAQELLESMSLREWKGPPPPDFRVGERPSKTVVVDPFPEAGAALTDQLRQAWTAALGQERADVLWRQSEPMVRTEFNGLGEFRQIHTIAIDDQGILHIWNSTQRASEERLRGWGSSSGPIDPNRLPPSVRPVLAPWLAAHAPPPQPVPMTP